MKREPFNIKHHFACRIEKLREVLHKQSTRTKRIYFLNKLLQDSAVSLFNSKIQML